MYAKRAAGSNVAGRTRRRKKGAGSRVAGRVKRKPVRRKKASGSNVAGRVRRKPVRKRASGSFVAGRVRRKPVRRRSRASGSLVAGGKWKDRLTYVPNKIVEHTFGRLAKSIWRRNRRR